MAEIIDGKALSKEIRLGLTEEVARMKEEKGIVPGLAVVLVGEDPASKVYVRNKEKACVQTGIYSEVYRLAEETSEQEVLDLINKLNADSKIHGILVQLPVPNHIDSLRVLETIDPKKDVDGFHPINVGKLFTGEDALVPCTPTGVMEMLYRNNVEIKGKEAVIVGRSNIVGKPMAALLLQEHATVTICHSRTADLGKHTREADILVVAAGRANMVTGDMVKPGAIVIDVGMNRVDDVLVGDVNFEEAKEVAGKITPVPGGVGPMTITMLLQNTLKAANNIVG